MAMKNKNEISLLIIAALLTISILLLHSFSPAAEAKKDTCCSDQTKKCPIEKKIKGSGELIIENLSRQFISIPSFTNWFSGLILIPVLKKGRAV